MFGNSFVYKYLGRGVSFEILVCTKVILLCYEGTIKDADNENS